MQVLICGDPPGTDVCTSTDYNASIPLLQPGWAGRQRGVLDLPGRVTHAPWLPHLQSTQQHAHPLLLLMHPAPCADSITYDEVAKIYTGKQAA